MFNLLIDVSERPIILKDTGKLFGTLKGFIFHGERLTFLYCKSQEKYVYIPVEEVILGQDAVILKTDYNETLISASVKPEIYTLDGKKIGTLSSIEFDDNFQIIGIKTEDQWISKDNIIHMDHIIVVESSKDKEEEDLFEEKTPDDVNSDFQENHELEFINNDLSLPTNTEEMVDKSLNTTLEHETSEGTITKAPSTENVTQQEEYADHIDARYKYLLGKRLLDNITIATESFARDSIIDGKLIQFALDNNGIVKVIMNSEE